MNKILHYFGFPYEFAGVDVNQILKNIHNRY